MSGFEIGLSLAWLRREWAVIRQAPRIFITWAVLCLLVAAWIMKLIYAERLDNKTNLSDTYKGQRDEAREEVGRLTKELSENANANDQINKEAGAISEPTAQLVIKSPLMTSTLPVKRGHAFQFQMRVINNGPKIARNLRWNVNAIVIETPYSAAVEETRLKPLISQLAADVPLSLKQELPAGEESRVARTYGMEGEGIGDHIRDDTLRIYIMARAIWEDLSGAHDAESCIYLRPPGNESLWNKCKSGHNFTR